MSLWIGLDWADQKHDLSCHPTDGSAAFTRLLAQDPAELESFFLQLKNSYPSIGLVVEQSRGPLIYALMKFDFITIYPVNPRSFAEFRRAFTVSGAKSDPKDGDLLAELGLKHHHRLRPLRPQDPITRELALLTEHRRDMVQIRTDCINRLRSTLKCYYPLLLALVGETLECPLGLDFLRRWPNLAVLQKARATTLRAFFYAHNSRNTELINQRLEAIKAAKPLTEDPAIIEPMQRMALAMEQQLRTLQRIIAGYDERIAEVFSQHANKGIFTELPGAGEVMAPRLAAAFGTRPDNWDSADNMSRLSGVAPVTKQSGKKKTVHFRWVRPIFLHQTFVEFAKYSIKQCDWARLLYEDLLARGKSTWMALRIVAFKWIRIIWRCWKSNTYYNDALYIKGLQKRGIKIYESLYPTTAAPPSE